jgi:Transcriptional regulator, AbiEi antitoxin
LPHSRGTIRPAVLSTAFVIAPDCPQILGEPNDLEPADHAQDVYSRHDVSDNLHQLAAMQAHVVTRDQALGHGLSRHSIGRLVESGAWRRLARGLFLTVPLEPSWESLAWAGVLLGGQFTRLGPESSGFLHQLLSEAPHPLDVLVPRERRVEVDGPWRLIRETPGVRSPRSIKDPPRLTIEATVLDLADVRDAGEVAGLITTAVQRRLTTVRRLRRELDERARHRHRSLLRDLLSDVEVGAESPIELRYLRDVERPHGLPKGTRQQSRSGLPYQTNVDYKKFRVIVELDGRIDHEGMGQFRDMNRDNRHALVDALTLRYGSYDLASRPCGVAFQVYCVLADRGYLEAFLRCRRCSAASEGDLLLA